MNLTSTSATGALVATLVLHAGHNNIVPSRCALPVPFRMVLTIQELIFTLTQEKLQLGACYRQSLFLYQTEFEVKLFK